MKKNLFLSVILLSFIALDSQAYQQIRKISGDNQTGMAGYPLDEDFVIRVTTPDGPVGLPAIPVVFSIIHQPAQPLTGEKAEATIFSGLSITDSFGYARARLNIGFPNTGDIVITAATEGSVGNPAVFKVVSRPRGWLFTMFFGIVGGLGLLLFGMFYLNEALQKIAGHKLKEILVTLTKSPIRGISTGLFVTLLNQSSHATTLLEVSLVSAGLLTFSQTMAVTMGAEIGSTITSQLLAFRLADYAIFIAGLGFYVIAFSHSKKWKHIGEAVLGFGVLFLGMKIMVDLLAPLKGYGPFMIVMQNVENPIMGIAVGMIFTAVIQSSGATAGIVIALALAGAINLQQAVLLNLGAQIGTCSTALIASVGRGREGKRVALWHLAHQTAGVLIIYPLLTLLFVQGEPVWLYFVKLFTQKIFFTQDLARQIAMAHTLAAVLNASVFFFLLPFVNVIMFLLMPSSAKERPFGPQFIDEDLLATPSLALEQARRETVREGQIALEMLKNSIGLFRCEDPKACDTVSLKDIRVDILRNAIVPYLSKVAQGSLSEMESQEQTKLLLIATDFEEIGDIIDKNIVPLARKKMLNGMIFSDEGWKEILGLHGRITENLELAVESLRSGDMMMARTIAESRAQINESESELRKMHVGRLNSGLKESLETSSVHLDLIDQFKRINSHTAAIGMTLLGKA